MITTERIRRLASLPPRVLLEKIANRLRREFSARWVRYRDARSATYTSGNTPSRAGLCSYVERIDTERLAARADSIRAVSRLYLDHRFDLLGSGWVRVVHGMPCRGVEGHRYSSGEEVHADPEGRWLALLVSPRNLAETQSRWRLVDPDYTPIDWQLDFKSGYRWNEKTWRGDIAYGHKPGVDVKVPWELARMQHLPQLAWAYALAAEGQVGFARPEVYWREFRNQVHDFTATNPPRFGVNWVCTMDVAIRAANWLLAYDLFRAAGVRFDEPFERVFCRAIHEHGLHIVNNLEWSDTLRGNHYLSDIAGLAFVAAYLPSDRQTDAWLALAVRQLVDEVGSQFTPDGASFEASTAYHRLSAEMVAFATSLILGLGAEKRAALAEYDHRLIKKMPRLEPAPLPSYLLSDGSGESPFPASYFERLERMAEFTVHVTKSNGQIHQVGDNDSGRFFKLQPAWNKMTVAEAKTRFNNLSVAAPASQEHPPTCAHGARTMRRKTPKDCDVPDFDAYWSEDHLDHRSVVAAINGLFGRSDLAEFSGGDRIETELIRQLSGDRTLGSYLAEGEVPDAARATVRGPAGWSTIISRIESDPDMRRHDHQIDLSGSDLLAGARCYCYADFGLFIIRSARLYLAVRCGPVGQLGNGGHAHNDQLSVELQVDGNDLIVDPGTYLYTADAGQRNSYRSVQAHFTPRCADGREPGSLDLGLFRLADRADAECLLFEPYHFVGRHFGFSRPVYRVVKLTSQAVRISDYADRRLRLEPPPEIGRASVPVSPLPLSPGYGIRAADATMIPLDSQECPRNFHSTLRQGAERKAC